MKKMGFSLYLCNRENPILKNIAFEGGVCYDGHTHSCSGVVSSLPVALVGVQARGFFHALMEKRLLLTCLV